MSRPESPRARAGHDAADDDATSFACPQENSRWFVRRKCNLVIVLNERFPDVASFEELADCVRSFDPSIDLAVVRDAPTSRLNLESRPTLVFSPALIRHYPCDTGRVFCGYPMSKSQEYSALQEADIPVPKWGLVTESENPDLSRFGVGSRLRRSLM